MQIRLFNTMTRKIEDFKPLVPNKVGIYTCGPTVYHFAHIGNLRSFVLADLLKRMFIENGYSVHNVMNITDVGHLTSDDDDSGEDKMEKGAARENKSVWDVAKFYTDAFLQDSNDLNILEPNERPRATEYIQEQIALIQKLEKLGYTYKISNDGIYYDTSKFVDYGVLTGGTLAGNRAGARVEYNSDKRNPTDFALWKFSPKDKKRAMEWDSPWGIGFPGWHTECCAMSMSLLGQHFDIHTGGTDLSRIHHNNEIAQSEPVVGKPWVNYWVHSEFLIDKSGDKMSKSAGDFLTLSVLKGRGYDPIAYRYMLLLGHYQSQLAFSWEALESASKGYKNIVRRVADILSDKSGDVDTAVFDAWHDKLLVPVSDNLKTAESLVVFQELLRDTSVNNATKAKLVGFVDNLLGLKFVDRANKLLNNESVVAPTEIVALANARTAAKVARDFARADELRAQIDAAGWTVVDTKDGAKLVKKA